MNWFKKFPLFQLLWHFSCQIWKVDLAYYFLTLFLNDLEMKLQYKCKIFRQYLWNCFTIRFHLRKKEVGQILQSMKIWRLFWKMIQKPQRICNKLKDLCPSLSDLSSPIPGGSPSKVAIFPSSTTFNLPHRCLTLFSMQDINAMRIIIISLPTFTVLRSIFFF